MNRGNLDFLYKMFPNHDLDSLDIIIVNQTSPDRQLISEYKSVQVINSYDKGLSKSRNLALENATSDWCLIADDDLVYVPNFEVVISEGIKEFNSSGVIVFKSLVEGSLSRRGFPEKSKLQLNVFEQFDVASFEMLLNRSNNGFPLFNTNFGLGSDQFLFGEETLLMYDYINGQMSVSYFNKAIVYHPIESTGTLYDHHLRYYTKGAILKHIKPNIYSLWVLIQLFFDVKQSKIKILNVCTHYKEAIRGVKKLNELTHATN